MQKSIVLAAAVMLTGSICSPNGPMAITSDTRDYCIKLAAHLSKDGEIPPHAKVLKERGQAMCETGHVRRGLFRLRRAMQIVRGTVE